MKMTILNKYGTGLLGPCSIYQLLDMTVMTQSEKTHKWM